jgi:hypothetical protein
MDQVQSGDVDVSTFFIATLLPETAKKHLLGTESSRS